MWLLRKIVSLPFEFDEKAADLAAGDGIEPVGRLIHNQQVGVVEQRLRQAQPLQHPLGKRPHAVPGPRRNPHHLQERHSPRANLTHGNAAELAVELQRRQAGQMSRDAEILGQIADPLSAAAVPGGKIEQRRLAGRPADDAQEDLDERCLAGAVGAQETENLAAADLESDVLERLLPLAEDEPLDVGLAEIFDGNGGVRHRSRNSGSRENT
jgi:hypothetical protein